MADYRKDTVEALYEAGFRTLVVSGVGELEARDEHIDCLQSQLEAHREACEAATGILCGHNLPGSSPLVLMARKATRDKGQLAAQHGALASTVAAIRDIVTHDVESKAEFIQRVRSVLSVDPDSRIREIEARAIERETEAALDLVPKHNEAVWLGAVALSERLEDAAARLRQQAKEAE